MGVGAGVGRTLRVCDIVGSVTLGCAGVGGAPAFLNSGAQSAGTLVPSDLTSSCGGVSEKVGY